MTSEVCLGLDDQKPVFLQKGARVNPKHSPPTSEQFSIFNIPLMLIPVHEKISPENNFFLSMIARAKKEIEAARLIVAIGYNFADQAFLKALGELTFADKNIILVTLLQDPVAEMDAHPAWKNISTFWKDASVKFFDGSGFGDFVSALVA